MVNIPRPALDAARLAEPMTALMALRGVVVIDEVHRRPDLFPALRVLADRRPRPAPPTWRGTRNWARPGKATPSNSCCTR